jgi:putative transposase
LVKNKGRPCGTGAQSERREGRARALIEQTERAKFWLKVVNELKVRGVNDILIALVDGLKGFPR